MLPIALAVLAIVLGGAGLYFGINASQQLSPLTDSVDAGTSSAARLEKQLASIETRLTELSARSNELAGTLERMRIYGTQNEQAVRQVTAAVRSNREEIVTLAERMKELAVTPRAAATSTATTTRSAASSGSSGTGRGEIPGAALTSSGSSDGGGTYTIRPGDTFAKIATEKGISLNALLGANPDVDTRRLQIGQIIQLP